MMFKQLLHSNKPVLWFNALPVRMFNVGGKSHNAPSSNIKEKHFKFPKHTELFAEDYYDD